MDKEEILPKYRSAPGNRLKYLHRLTGRIAVSFTDPTGRPAGLPFPSLPAQLYQHDRGEHDDTPKEFP